VDEEIAARRVLDELDRLEVPYVRIPIDPAHADTATFCERHGYPLGHSGNTLIVAAKREPKTYAACVVRADVNHNVRRLMGASRLSFATADETRELTGMAIGGVTAVALPPDLPIYVDEGLMRLEYVILGSGDRLAKIKISPEVFRRLPNARIVAGITRAIGVV